MRMPPPRTSAWQDRPPTPENVQHKQVQLEQPLNKPGPSKLLSRREVSARQDAMTYLVRVRGLLSGW